MSPVYSSSSVCNDDKNYFSSEIHEETTQTSIHLSITEQQTPFNLASKQSLVAQANSSLFAGVRPSSLQDWILSPSCDGKVSQLPFLSLTLHHAK